jgi:hypothetical protein
MTTITRRSASPNIARHRIRERDGARRDFQVELLDGETFADTLKPEFFGAKADVFQPGDRIAIVGQNPLQLQIQTSPAVVPQSQMISGPERLVIDIPNTVPAASLRGIAVNRREVKDVRVSQFSTTPPVTRIVVDLNSPQSYRVANNSSGLLVSLGDAETTANAPTIGWVAAKVGVKVASPPVSALVSSSGRKNSLHPAVAANGVSVQFANGLLSIHATGATLSEVLFQIQKQTGAEIAIPAGTEQDRVAANFGPGPASEVLGELLTGSGLNFVVVGSETDSKVLRSVILSRKSNAPPGPVPAPQAYAPAAENIPPESQEMLTPPDDNTAQPQPTQPPNDAGSPTPPPTP